MVNEERCPTKLVADAPATVDAFGGHETVAQSIVEVLLTEHGGRSIGLEGGWGAGKSTVVNLVSKEVSQSRGVDYRVVVFDTWAHQGDPLRRTFLENVIARIQYFGWVDSEKWSRRLAELSNRRREETTSVVPRLTVIGILFAFTLLAIPAGSALISAGATLWASENASWVFAAALLMAGVLGVLLPALSYGAFAVHRHCRKNANKEGGVDEGLRGLPALVTGQSSTESHTIVTQTPDPTSVEFEEVFFELLSEALSTEDRNLLLVIDNLDRVRPWDALSIWSTLQTFLGHSDYRQAEWIDRLWVLIPYDESAILRLWDRSDRESTEDTNSALATSFLDKTFQLRFRVPPLLISNWREFLQDALQLALPHHRAADFHEVCRVFSIEGELERSAPTPRDLKIFVNQIGTLHRMWQDDFPLSYLACYVLMLKNGQDIRDALLSREGSNLARRIIGEQWREVTAALHFGVPTEEARELLLRGPIESALTNGNASRLSELEAIHPAGFWAVLEDYVLANVVIWDVFGSTDLAKAATTLTDSRVLDHIDRRPEANTLRESILTAAASVSEWLPFDATNSRGMVSIGRLAGDSEETIIALLAGASNTPVEPTSGRGDYSVTPSVWMDSAFTLIQGFIDLGFVRQVEEGFEISLDAQQWLDVSQEIIEKDPGRRILQYFHLKAIAEIDEVLAQQVANNEIGENTFCAVVAAIATRSRTGLKNSTAAVFSRLMSGEQFNGEQLASMMKIIRFSVPEGLITTDQITEFATGGRYLHYLYHAVNDSHPEAVGECMFGFLQAVPDASEPTPFGNSQPGYQYLTQLLANPDMVPRAVDAFTEIAKETQQLSVIFEIATAEEVLRPFVVECLRDLLENEGDSINPDLVRRHWDAIRVALKDDEELQSFEAFLGQFTGIALIVAGVVEEAFEASDSGLYVAIMKIDVYENFEKWCVNGLSSVNKEIWLEEITSQGDLVELVIELKAKNANLALGVPFFDALVDYARCAAEGSEEIIPDETWHELYGLLDANQKDLFSRRAYDVLAESDGAASEEFFILFGDVLSDRRLLANAHSFIDRVCRPILDARNAKGIEWIVGIAEAETTLIAEHSDQPAVRDFKERIRQSHEDTPTDDETFAHIKRIAVALGIDDVDPEQSAEELEGA